MRGQPRRWRGISEAATLLALSAREPLGRRLTVHFLKFRQDPRPPVRLRELVVGGVFEELADREKEHARQALRVDAHVEIHFVIEEKQPARAEHAEALALHLEIVRGDDSVADRELRRAAAR